MSVFYSYKQSMAEAHTLASVKQQLDKLDCLVSHDVAVLRDKIENANREYDNARWVGVSFYTKQADVNYVAILIT